MIPRIVYADASRKWHQAGTERLTHYELACGSVMALEVCGQRLVLWREPATNVYAVRLHDHIKHERVFWETFTTYTSAARLYYRTKRKLERNDKHVDGKGIECGK